MLETVWGVVSNVLGVLMVVAMVPVLIIEAFLFVATITASFERTKRDF